MARRKTNQQEDIRRFPPPAKDPDSRKKQLISLAVDLAEKQLRDGTAKAMIVKHFLDESTDEAKLREENLKLKNALLEAQAENLRYQQHSGEMYEAAINAFKRYSGADLEDEYYD